MARERQLPGRRPDRRSVPVEGRVRAGHGLQLVGVQPEAHRRPELQQGAPRQRPEPDHRRQLPPGHRRSRHAHIVHRRGELRGGRVVLRVRVRRGAGHGAPREAGHVQGPVGRTIGHVGHHSRDRPSHIRRRRRHLHVVRQGRPRSVRGPDRRGLVRGRAEGHIRVDVGRQRRPVLRLAAQRDAVGPDRRRRHRRPGIRGRDRPRGWHPRHRAITLSGKPCDAEADAHGLPGVLRQHHPAKEDTPQDCRMPSGRLGQRRPVS
ncbi:hypothetical protein MUK42_36718 [Musa troglodytarum]|uniref:Uncharacterized protein n=1 Tax=Musa troglodytarum TaxID=320322 RepID=A0A9E7HW57_9LILI|nr:hypothetical protein MUK42_36718 [Musa troglodytarum]